MLNHRRQLIGKAGGQILPTFREIQIHAVYLHLHEGGRMGWWGEDENDPEEQRAAAPVGESGPELAHGECRD
jgi:hypothetical protein